MRSRVLVLGSTKRTKLIYQMTALEYTTPRILHKASSTQRDPIQLRPHGNWCRNAIRRERDNKEYNCYIRYKWLQIFLVWNSLCVNPSCYNMGSHKNCDTHKHIWNHNRYIYIYIWCIYLFDNTLRGQTRAFNIGYLSETRQISRSLVCP